MYIVKVGTRDMHPYVNWLPTIALPQYNTGDIVKIRYPSSVPHERYYLVL